MTIEMFKYLSLTLFPIVVLWVGILVLKVLKKDNKKK